MLQIQKRLRLWMRILALRYAKSRYYKQKGLLLNQREQYQIKTFKRISGIK